MIGDASTRSADILVVTLDPGDFTGVVGALAASSSAGDSAGGGGLGRGELLGALAASSSGDSGGGGGLGRGELFVLGLLWQCICKHM